MLFSAVLTIASCCALAVHCADQFLVEGEQFEFETVEDRRLLRVQEVMIVTLLLPTNAINTKANNNMVNMVHSRELIGAKGSGKNQGAMERLLRQKLSRELETAFEAKRGDRFYSEASIQLMAFFDQVQLGNVKNSKNGEQIDTMAKYAKAICEELDEMEKRREPLLVSWTHVWQTMKDRVRAYAERSTFLLHYMNIAPARVDAATQIALFLYVYLIEMEHTMDFGGIYRTMMYLGDMADWQQLRQLKKVFVPLMADWLGRQLANRLERRLLPKLSALDPTEWAKLGIRCTLRPFLGAERASEMGLDYEFGLRHRYRRGGYFLNVRLNHEVVQLIVDVAYTHALTGKRLAHVVDEIRREFGRWLDGVQKQQFLDMLDSAIELTKQSAASSHVTKHGRSEEVETALNIVQFYGHFYAQLAEEYKADERQQAQHTAFSQFQFRLFLIQLAEQEIPEQIEQMSAKNLTPEQMEWHRRERTFFAFFEHAQMRQTQNGEETDLSGLPLFFVTTFFKK